MTRHSGPAAFAPGAAAMALLALAVASGCGGTRLMGTEPNAPPRTLHGPPVRGYLLAWHDEFDGAALDSSRWNVVSGKRRDTINTPAAVSVSGGILTITTYTDAGVHYTGFIDTAGKYEPTYGYLEARIRFESSPGEWGAFWLQSPTMGTPIGSPNVAGTEIDIVEHRVRDAQGADIGNSYEMNLHWDGYGAGHRHAGSVARPTGDVPPLQGNWHAYSLLWTPSEYVFFLDGIEQWRSRDAVSKRSEYIRLTCEALDKGWAGSIPATGYLGRHASTTRMQVDWLRIYQPRPKRP